MNTAGADKNTLETSTLLRQLGAQHRQAERLNLHGTRLEPFPTFCFERLDDYLDKKRTRTQVNGYGLSAPEDQLAVEALKIQGVSMWLHSIRIELAKALMHIDRTEQLLKKACMLKRATLSQRSASLARGVRKGTVFKRLGRGASDQLARDLSQDRQALEDVSQQGRAILEEKQRRAEEIRVHFNESIKVARLKLLEILGGHTIPPALDVFKPIPEVDWGEIYKREPLIKQLRNQK